MQKKVLLAGLGNMGLPMIKNLKARSQFDVYAFDILEDKMTEAQKTVR